MLNKYSVLNIYSKKLIKQKEYKNEKSITFNAFN